MKEDKPTLTTMSGDTLYKKKVEPIKNLVEELLPESSIIFLGGKSGTFKTGYALHLAICGAIGQDVFGEFPVTRKFRTLFIDEENGLGRTKIKFDRMLDNELYDEPDRKNIRFSIFSKVLLTQPWVDAIEKVIEKYDIDLVIIDNIARCFVGSERDEENVKKLHRLLKPICEKTKVSFIIIHHTKKKDHRFDSSISLEDLSGSRDFGAQCDEAYIIDRYRTIQKDKKTIFKLYQVKAKDGFPVKSFNFNVIGDITTTLSVEFAGYIEDNIKASQHNKLRDIKDIIIEYMQSNPKETYKTKELIEVVQAGGFSEDDARNAIYRDEKIPSGITIVSLEKEGILKSAKTMGQWIFVSSSTKMTLENWS